MRSVTVFAVAAVVLFLPSLAAGDESIDFNQQIRPILADNCFACHGPDEKKRKADLRLDTRQGAFAELDDHVAIVPGKSADSELYQRLIAEDPSDRMPPKKFGKQLTAEQIELIRRWIDQGATWSEHWAYTRLVRPAVPDVDNVAVVRNAVDSFVLAKLAANDLQPASPADRVTLIRRLSFDLLGLPPTAEDVEAFAADTDIDAYAKLVDRLLASPHYGERMAMRWLDLVRYADSVGYHGDQSYSVWPYRDYIINAFNDNMPFDRFTLEQIAGDLLPDATRDQQVASGYNRLNMITAEGGAQDKEYLAKYAADRVRTISGVWMGATVGCAECHDHKYDPYTTKDFYSLAAFFADLKEKGFYGGAHVSGQWGPTLMLPNTRQDTNLKKLEKQLATLNLTMNTSTPKLVAAQTKWEQSLGDRKIDWTILHPAGVKAKNGATLTIADDGTITASGENPAQDVYTITVPTQLAGMTALRLEVLPDDALPAKGPGRAANGNFVLNEFAVAVGDKPVALAAASATHAQEAWAVAGAVDGKPDTGWAILNQTGQGNHAVFETKTDLPGGGETTMTINLTQNYGSAHTLGRFRLAATNAARPVRAEGDNGQPKEIADILAVDAATRSDAQKNKLAAHYRSIAPQLESARKQLADLTKQKDALVASIPTMLVSVSVEPRVMRILNRGNWMDESGEIVRPAVPGFVAPPSMQGRELNRLDLGKWLASADNPMCARTVVNRLFKTFFGTGLSKVLDDLGAQGELPSHPELLDWLAVEFMESGWDLKHVIRVIISSATYRQSSVGSAALRERDPYNRLLARQSRFRLDAEMVRDNALTVSGLIVHKLGGPSVKPYQPPGYYAQLNFPKRTYQHDNGENQYRRGVYTHWQRTFLHPAMLAFDAPSREECTAERTRSNTPLQALVLLNDPTYVEAARVFAHRILTQGGATVADRLDWAFRQALSRAVKPEEAEILAAMHRKHLDQYTADPAAAQQLVATGLTPASSDVNVADLAAWTSIARTILNLHETISRN